MLRSNWKSLLIGIAIGAMVFASAPVIADIGDPVLQGRGNNVDARTTLRGEAAAPNLRLINESQGRPGLSVFTEPGTPPLKVNRKAKVDNLNADLLDGRHGTYFVSKVARPGDTLAGGYVVSGAEGDPLLVGISFPTTLPAAVPNANMHYLAPGDPVTGDCPGQFQAAPGHLCVYGVWQNAATFQQFIGIDSGASNASASPHGFGVHFAGSGTSPNARGNWAYTVPPLAADIPVGSPDDGLEQTPDSSVSSGS